MKLAFDFTASANLFGPDPAIPAIELETGVDGLIAGDVTANGLLQYSGPGNDRGPIIAKIIAEGGTELSDIISDGYWFEDVNMNDEVRYTGSANDRGVIIANLGELTGSPWLNAVYESVVPGAFEGMKDAPVNNGPVDIFIEGNNLVLYTNESFSDPLLDNLQFTLAWEQDDDKSQKSS
ncbi:MAG: hypothetical protein U5Q03_11830 [Bacteroidota bacterium]|nr:hypothetical protein [Bacteroidota bacterium]